jgi:hypothetical protein
MLNSLTSPRRRWTHVQGHMGKIHRLLVTFVENSNVKLLSNSTPLLAIVTSQLGANGKTKRSDIFLKASLGRSARQDSTPSLRSRWHKRACTVGMVLEEAMICLLRVVLTVDEHFRPKSSNFTLKRRRPPSNGNISACIPNLP